MRLGLRDWTRRGLGLKGEKWKWREGEEEVGIRRERSMIVESLLLAPDASVDLRRGAQGIS